MKRMIKIMLVPSMVVAFSLAANATTYYVSPSGDDSAAGTSEETALLTPQKGISKASSGDTVMLLPGTYPLTERLSIGASDFTLMGSTGNPRDVVLDGQSKHVGMEIPNADGITVSSLTISNAWETTARYYTRAAGITLGDRSTPTESGKTKLVTNCVFTCCKANSQNGEFVVKMDVTSRVVDCLFEKNTNTSGTSGEVVRMCHGGELIGCTIEDNAGRGVYGYIESDKEASIAAATSMVVRGCTIRNNTGRGIYNVPQIYDSLIEGHSADNGAGFFFEKDKAANLPANFQITVSNTTFTGNTATKEGSAAYVHNRCAFIGCTVTNNVAASDGDGAAIYGNVSDASATSLVVRACTIRNNTGRGLYNVPTVRDSWIEGNTATCGAGLYGHPQLLDYLPADFCVTISNTTFFGNAATTGYGGAFSWGNWASTISNVVIDSCAFISNTLSRTSADRSLGGGAISISLSTVGANVAIRNSLFEGNTQLDAGTVVPGAAINIQRDTREVGGGGMIRIENCTFVGNRNESGDSDAVFLTGRYGAPVAYVTNCVFACNLKKVNGEMVETAGLTSQSHAVAYSYLYPASSSTYEETVINGTKAPNFQEGTWIPSGNSPMRDAGVLLSWMTGAKDLQRDANGKAIRDRVLGSAPDMGCFEYQPLGLLLILR